MKSKLSAPETELLIQITILASEFVMHSPLDLSFRIERIQKNGIPMLFLSLLVWPVSTVGKVTLFTIALTPKNFIWFLVAFWSADIGTSWYFPSLESLRIDITFFLEKVWLCISQWTIQTSISYALRISKLSAIHPDTSISLYSSHFQILEMSFCSFMNCTPLPNTFNMPLYPFLQVKGTTILAKISLKYLKVFNRRCFCEFYGKLLWGWKYGQLA